MCLFPILFVIQSCVNLARGNAAMAVVNNCSIYPIWTNCSLFFKPLATTMTWPYLAAQLGVSRRTCQPHTRWYVCIFFPNMVFPWHKFPSLGSSDVQLTYPDLAGLGYDKKEMPSLLWPTTSTHNCRICGGYPGFGVFSTVLSRPSIAAMSKCVQ